MTKQFYERYKETGNPWLGKVPSEWRVRRADFVIKSRKLQITPSDLENSDVYHYAIPTVQVTGAGAVEEGESIDSGKLIINEPQVLVSKLNPRKATVTIAEPHPDYLTVASTEFVPLIPWEADLSYMFYVWKSQKVTDRLSSFVQSVTRSHQRCDPAEITKIPWAWPSQGEQQKIAAFLDRKTAEIDTLIAKKRRLLERLAEKRTALITRAVTKGLNPDAPMKDSGIEWLGKIPAHWQVKKLKFLGDLIIGLTYSPSDVCSEAEGTLVLRASNIQRGRIILNDNVYVDTEVPDKLRTKIGDILICSRNGSQKLVGKAAIIDEQSSGMTFGAFNMVLRSGYSHYLFYLFASGLVSQQAGLYQTSTIFQLTTGMLKEFRVPVPPGEDQEKIIAYIQEQLVKHDKVADKIDSALRKLEEYRSALITNAVTGQIKVV